VGPLSFTREASTAAVLASRNIAAREAPRCRLVRRHSRGIVLRLPRNNGRRPRRHAACQHSAAVKLASTIERASAVKRAAAIECAAAIERANGQPETRNADAKIRQVPHLA
jgi:hypothetical protein